jgi:hypothetical protein
LAASLLVGGYFVADKNIVQAQSAEAYYISYENVADRVQNADMIIEATLAGTPQNFVVNDKDGFISGYTLSNIQINKVFKGNAKFSAGQSINIREPYFVVENGLMPGKTELTMEDYTKMQQDSRYILFLQWNEANNVYDISSLHEGKFNIDGKDVKEVEKSTHNVQYKKLKDAVIENYAK